MQTLNLLAVAPEIVLLITAALVLLADAVGQNKLESSIDRIALLALLVPMLPLLAQVGHPVEYAFDGMYVSDDLARLLKLFAFIAVGFSLSYGRVYARARGMYRGEFYALALFSLLGQMVMISANNLLVVYLGLELMTLSLYALAAMRRDSATASEAAIKYFVLGALASGFLLYGMSMIYGATGSLDLPDIAKSFSAAQTNRLVLVFGVVFVVAGLAFKFGAVPFHMWVPDVYQGTPTVATLLIAGAPKLAAFAIAFRVLVEGLSGIAADWQQMLVVLAVMSMVFGNLIAIAQSNFKRMLAYSTIAQVGFVLLGLATGVVDGKSDGAADAYSGAMFYMVTYVLTTLGTFGLIQLLAREGFESEGVSDLKGLGKRSPMLALAALIMMFSLAGIPPTVGFYAKFAVLQSVVASGQVWLAIVAVLASLVGAFYYLRIVKTMYFDEPVDTQPVVVEAGTRSMLIVNGGLLLLLGLLPSGLMSVCLMAVRQALGT